MRFNHLNVPSHWEQYWTKYPEGYTILEALINWVSQVDSMVDNVNDWNTYLDDFVENFDKKLEPTVRAMLREMEADGTLTRIINTEIFDDLNTKATHSINGKNIHSLSDYARIAPEATDSGRLERLIAATPAGGVAYLGHDTVLAVSTTLSITKPIQILAHGVELQTVTEGMDNSIHVNGVTGFKISGVRFNQNLKGRTSITLFGCSLFEIRDCFFTGYSKQYSYYQTDGGVRLDNSNYGAVINNTWQDHGNQYTAATADLNRCLTIQGGSHHVAVKGNTFRRVNQAIVTDGTDIRIMDNTFYDIQDNCVYGVGVSRLVITDNHMENKRDENIVVNGENIIISDNFILHSPNKAIAINGTSKNISIINNTFDNSLGTTGKLISWRDTADLVEGMTIEGNTFIHPNMSQTNTEHFEFGNVKGLLFKDNYVNVKTAANQRILFFKGDTATGVIEGNELTGTDASAKSIELQSTVLTVDLLYRNNKHTNCRGVYSELLTIQDQGIRHDIGPYIESRTTQSRLSSSSMPTRGTFKKGTVVFNTGNDYNVLCWRRATDGSTHVLGTDWIEIR